MVTLQKATKEYQELYLEKYGVSLDEKEATKQAIRLIDCFRLFLKPLDLHGASVKHD